MSTEAPDFVNADVDEIQEEIREDQREQQRELSEAERTKQRILQAVESQTVTIEVVGEEIEMQILGGEEEDWLEDQIGAFSEKDDPDDLEEGEYSQYREARERLVEMLADHAVDAAYDYAFWKALPSETRFSAMADLRSGGGETEAADGFREE